MSHKIVSLWMRRMAVGPIWIALFALCSGICNAYDQTFQHGSARKLQTSTGETLLQLVEAVGGQDALMNFNTLKIESTGETWVQFEGLSPDLLAEACTYTRTTIIDVTGEGRQSVVENRTGVYQVFEFFPVTTVETVIQGQVGGTSGGFFIDPGTMSSESVAAQTRLQMLLNPHLLLRQVLMTPDIAYVKTDDLGFTVLGITQEDSTMSDVFLYIDKKSGLPRKLVTAESQPLRGDMIVVFNYKGWNIEAGSLRFPSKIEVRSKGGLLWQDFRTSVEVDPTVPESVFTYPDGTDPDSLVPGAYQFGLQSEILINTFWQTGFNYQYNPGFGDPVELVPDTLWFLPANAHSLVIKHDGGAIIVDAPASFSHGANLVSLVANLTNNAIVTHVVQSHHHMDHSSGIREVVALTDTPLLVVGDGVEKFWKSILDASSTIRPDSLSMEKFWIPWFAKKLILEVKQGESITLVDQDDGLKVSVHGTNRDPSASDVILVLIDTGTERYIWVVDFYIPVPLEFIPGGFLGFFDALRDLELINADCTAAADIPLTVVDGHFFPQSLEDAIQNAADAGVDVGCP